MSELAENMGLEEEVEEQETRKPFVVDDDRKAEWVLQQIRNKKAEIQKWKEHYEALSNKVCNDLQSDIAWFEGNLKGYFLQKMDEGATRSTKTQTIYDLPSGKLVMKPQDPEFEKDEPKMIEWLEQSSPELVKVKKSVDWSGMKKAFCVSGDKMITEDAEIIPGVVVHERENIFKVEVK